MYTCNVQLLRYACRVYRVMMVMVGDTHRSHIRNLHAWNCQSNVRMCRVVDLVGELAGGWTSLWCVVGDPCGWVDGSPTARARVAAYTIPLVV